MSNKTLNVSLPIYIKTGKKTHSLTLNNYRNWHYMTSNNIKKSFCLHILPDLMGSPKFPGMIEVEYKLYVKNKIKSDLMNWVSVVDKFFLDALVQRDIIKEDNYEYIQKVNIEFCGQDKDRPRIEATIRECYPSQVQLF